MALFGLFGKKKKEEPVSAPKPEPKPAPKPELTPEEMYEKGVELFCADRHNEAYPLLKKTCTLPKEGEPEPNVDGVVALAWLMENGKGCQQNKDEALRYFAWAAERDSREGMDGVVRLVIEQQWPPGEMCRRAARYAELREEEQNTDAARMRTKLANTLLHNIIEMELLEADGENGSAMDQYTLGLRFYEGIKAPKDMEKAFYWFKKAAEQGDADAQANCGVMYFFGNGTEVDKGEAYYLFLKAASQGNELAVENRQIMERNTSREARDAVWYGIQRLKEDAEAGDEVAKKAVAPIIAQEMKEERERVMAELQKHERAARQGDQKAMIKCAEHYYLGNRFAGIERDYVKALYWYDELIKLGDTDTFYWCGNMYYKGGHGIEADKAKALTYYKKGAELGEKNAQCEYGLMLVKGEAAAVDRETGRRWIEKAAAQDYGYARCKLEELFGPVTAK